MYASHLGFLKWRTFKTTSSQPCGFGD